jgi:ribosomal protein L19E
MIRFIRKFFKKIKDKKELNKKNFKPSKNPKP